MQLRTFPNEIINQNIFNINTDAYRVEFMFCCIHSTSAVS